MLMDLAVEGSLTRLAKEELIASEVGTKGEYEVGN